MNTENVLTALFAEILGYDDIEPDETFFDLGGHSLSALELRARIRDKLAVDVPIEEIVASGSVAHLATFVGAERKRDG